VVCLLSGRRGEEERDLLPAYREKNTLPSLLSLRKRGKRWLHLHRGGKEGKLCSSLWRETEPVGLSGGEEGAFYFLNVGRQGGRGELTYRIKKRAKGDLVTATLSRKKKKERDRAVPSFQKRGIVLRW